MTLSSYLNTSSSQKNEDLKKNYWKL